MSFVPFPMTRLSQEFRLADCDFHIFSKWCSRGWKDWCVKSNSLKMCEVVGIHLQQSLADISFSPYFSGPIIGSSLENESLLSSFFP